MNENRFDREDLKSLLRWLDEDPEFRAALRRRLLAKPLIIEVRLLTDWMAKVDSRLDSLEKDMGILNGNALEVEYRTKAASIFGMMLRGRREASEFVSGQLEEAEIQGTVSPQEADFVMAADLLWVGTFRKGKYAGEVIVFVGENSWTDVERAAKKAEILKRAGVWAVPFVGGSEWASSEVREEALERKILCIVDGKVEPSRDNWEQLEQTLAFGEP